MKKSQHYIFVLLMFYLMICQTTSAGSRLKGNSGDILNVKTPLVYINTLFENASPLFWHVEEDGKINIELMYDHQRNTLNRATAHWFFQLQAKAGSDLTLVLENFYNIWNGRVDISDATDKTACFVSEDGRNWQAVDTEYIKEGHKLEVKVHMNSDSLYVARLEPYRISDLETLKSKIAGHPLIKITEIGKTFEGRSLEIIRVGHSNAPNRIFIRARAHGWEAGGNWVVQGLIKSLISDSYKSNRYLDKYAVYIMPMANKDRVARGGSRFSVGGEDLNRKWDKPADPKYSPENVAFEGWLEQMIEQGLKPDLAIDFHNDGYGRLHISRPNVGFENYLANIKRFEKLLRIHTWFTEGSTVGDYPNPSSFGEGLLKRYGIDACILEFNGDWIAGLSKVPFGKDWELFGQQLRDVFYDYFGDKK